MTSDAAPTPDAHQFPAPGRRRVLALGAWSAGLALTGSVAARSRAATTAASRPHTSATPATPVAAPTAAPSAAAPAPVSPVQVPVASASAARPGAALSGDALILHVARRATFGPTPALLDAIRREGVDGWLERQLTPRAIPDAAVDEQLVGLRDLSRTAADFKALGRFEDDVLGDLRVAALLRAVQSTRHLNEVMVDLWHDHLTASAAKGAVAWHLPAYDRDVIRPHALGRFVDLLRAATRSGAMLEFLDTAGSAAPAINENHGRELLELHTVGRASGFTQADVTGAARVLSGWTLDQHLGVVYDATRHDARPATVLGWSTPGRRGGAGAADLDGLLRHLATHPATAKRIAALLARRFVADRPPPSVVASTAAAYLASGTDIAATLRHLFRTPEFRSGGTAIVRRPFDLLAAQLRATGAALDIPNTTERLVAVPAGVDPMVGQLVDPLLSSTGGLDPVVEPLVRGAIEQRPIAQAVADILRRNGQLLFMAPSPSGHALTGSRWVSGDALLRRWTLSALLANNGFEGMAVDPVPLAGGARTAGAATDALARRCFGAPASATTRTAALTALGRAASDRIDLATDGRTLLAFLLAAPEMQTR